MKKKVRKFISREELRGLVKDDGIRRTTVSFYKYVNIVDPVELKAVLEQNLGNLGCLGRIYIANEGINAQMNVSASNWSKFDVFIKSLDGFEDIPYKIAIEEGENSSFYKLTIKAKEKIVADGLDDNSFDPSDTAPYLTAEETNEYIDDPETTVIDMRNEYEAEVGHFQNAQIMQVDTFKEQLAEVEGQFENKKDSKVLIYCTGGIRCEKASAWMKHKGFKNVRHVKGGIIDYARQAKEEGIENKFRGKNFVFDERLGESISDEVIATCHLCKKTKADTHYHCKSQACHILFIGCEGCMKKKDGYCSYKCMTFDKLPGKVKEIFTHNNHKKKLTQFKKHRMKL